MPLRMVCSVNCTAGGSWRISLEWARNDKPFGHWKRATRPHQHPRMTLETIATLNDDLIAGLSPMVARSNSARTANYERPPPSIDLSWGCPRVRTAPRGDFALYNVRKIT